MEEAVFTDDKMSAVRIIFVKLITEKLIDAFAVIIQMDYLPLVPDAAVYQYQKRRLFVR
jgi:hypothetical protein